MSKKLSPEEEYIFYEKIKQEARQDPKHKQFMEEVEEKVRGIKERNQQEPAEVFGRIGQARSFIQEQPIFYDKNNIWWVWNKDLTFWEITDETDILNNILDNLNLDIISSKSRGEILNALKQVGRKNKPKEIKETWIQFRDTIVDINTGEELKANPEYFVTNPIPWKLHEERFIETPTMDRIFEEWVGKEHVKTLYEILAYCLLPSYPIHRLFCFIGGGMNGKSCYLRLLEKFIGHDNTTSTELDTLLTSRFEITKLHKKLVCMMGETNFNEMSKTSILKKLTGQDSIGFEYKNKTPFDGINYAKILIATNNLPTTTDKTIGFYRRWTIIDFPNRFSETKDILSDIPDEEYEALAVKSLFILRNLLNEKKFYNEGSLEDRQKKYEDKSDFLQKFLKDFTKESINSYITKSDFNKKFVDWCDENRHRHMAERTLAQRMKEKGIADGRKYLDWMFEGKGGYARVWLDITWK